MPLSELPDAYYTDARWEKRLDRVRQQELDPEEEADARLLLHLQDDTPIAVAKIQEFKRRIDTFYASFPGHGVETTNNWLRQFAWTWNACLG